MNAKRAPWRKGVGGGEVQFVPPRVILKNAKFFETLNAKVKIEASIDSEEISGPLRGGAK